MPPKAKLHSRNGKLKSITRSKAPAQVSSSSNSSNLAPVAGPSTNTTATDDMDRQLEVEICWCIHQLEEALSSNKLSPKQAQESYNIMNTLKSKTQPTIRKRQLMRTHFGDYRAKMAAEEKKAKSIQNQISFKTSKTSNNKCTFLRKAVTLTTGDSSFKFNFQPQIDSDANNKEKCDMPIVNNDKSEEANMIAPIKNDFSQLSINSSSDFKFNFQIEDGNAME